MTWWEAGLRLLTAAAAGSVIGVEREKKNRPAGMRTHVLVCVGAALIAIVEAYIAADTVALNLANPDAGVAVSMGRLSAQVISGIGFLGAGTIFISQKKIARTDDRRVAVERRLPGAFGGHGLLWLTAAGCALVMVTLTLMQRVIRVNTIKNVEVKFVHRVETLTYINDYFEKAGIKVLDVDFHVESKGKYNLYTNLYTLDMPSRTTYTDIVNHLAEYVNVQSIRTRNV